ncbi:MAG TPA: hypothetical protein VEG66_04930 [Thermoplasmata archaeon]|nr:hypothetical protein [Thermoplasmata archaeon]
MDRPSRRTARRVGILVIVFGLIVGLGFLSGIPAAPALTGLGHPGTAQPPASSSSASPAATAKPTLVLNLTSGVVGISVLANGTGFAATTAISKFTFNGTTPTVQTCTAQTTNKYGNFSCTFVVPKNLPGPYDVNATGADAASDNATAVFKILTPTVLLTPSTAVSSSVVTVSGIGFTRLLTITAFTFNKATPAMQTCVGQAIDRNGSWGPCTFVVPSELPGPYNVSAVGSDGVPDNATAVFTVPATTVTVYLDTPFSTYTVLPSTVVLNITVTNSVIATTSTWLWLNVTDYVTGIHCGSNNISAMITNATPALGSSFLSEILTFPLTTGYFVNDTKACPNLAADSAWLQVMATVNGGPNGVGVATGVQYGFCSAVIGVGWCVPTVTSFVFTPPTSLLHVSQVSGAIYTYSLYANYSGQYTGKVLLTIYNPSGTGVVFSYNLRWNGTSPTVVKWIETTPATYPYILAVSTAYGAYSTSGSIVVSPATYVYTNETSWTNSTFIPGLSSGAAGSLLLVVGLIVGMIVAIVVGRRVWAGPKPAGPAQPWTPKTAAANECSVCGRSFATPEELAAHSKSEHGMQ